MVVLGGGVEPDKTTNESLGLIGGGDRLHGGGGVLGHVVMSILTCW